MVQCKGICDDAFPQIQEQRRDDPSSTIREQPISTRVRHCKGRCGDQCFRSDSSWKWPSPSNDHLLPKGARREKVARAKLPATCQTEGLRTVPSDVRTCSQFAVEIWCASTNAWVLVQRVSCCTRAVAGLPSLTWSLTLSACLISSSTSFAGALSESKVKGVCRHRP